MIRGPEPGSGVLRGVSSTLRVDGETVGSSTARDEERRLSFFGLGTSIGDDDECSRTGLMEIPSTCGVGGAEIEIGR